ncbi:MAG TPA: phosphotransferase family protein [Pyrinomonadaceae bacterium]|jgi:aminoglycoside phosphotransferase (APT) family kinase protein|nr:phosphotransferase family protein [Pyrinomonadaceae bacterium]
MTARDSTAVRAGEELDLAVLDSYLRQQLAERVSHLDPSATIEIEQFPGGHSNLTYLIRYGDREFVLRRPPVGPVAPTAHDMPREYKLLSVINPHFPLAPKPVLLCEDASIIGVPFYLMERRRGFIVRLKLPSQVGEDLALRRRLSESVVDTLGALHAVDIQATGIGEIGKPAGFVQRQVRGWADRWQRSKTGELAEMDQVIQWLADRIPAELNGVATIVHNDFKLDNLMLDENDPARVVAVLDWEMCTVGDPLVDVGLALSYWTMSGGRSAGSGGGKSEPNSSLRAITNGPGWMTRAEIIERYEMKTGRDLSRIAFYETFARFKVAVVIQQIYFRYVQGQTSDERFRNFDQLVRQLAHEALELAQHSGI